MLLLYFSQPPNREDTPTPQPSDKASSINQTPVEANEFPQLPEGLEKKPIVLKFSAMMDGITIGAALLPSLKAEYKMGQMKSHGMTGERSTRGKLVYEDDRALSLGSGIKVSISLLSRGPNQFHLRVAQSQALLPVQGVPGGHVHHASHRQPHAASRHHVGRVHHGGPREPLRPGLGPRRLPGQTWQLPAGQLPALCGGGMRRRVYGAGQPVSLCVSLC